MLVFLNVKRTIFGKFLKRLVFYQLDLPSSGGRLFGGANYREPVAELVENRAAICIRFGTCKMRRLKRALYCSLLNCLM